MRRYLNPPARVLAVARWQFTASLQLVAGVTCFVMPQFLMWGVAPWWHFPLLLAVWLVATWSNNCRLRFLCEPTWRLTPEQEAQFFPPSIRHSWVGASDVFVPYPRQPVIDPEEASNA